jgi:catechol 2,3-dioxygenase-like lactoylglutathione lyase family enzyme
MLNQARPLATIAVRDLDAAKQYYGSTLGLRLVDENPGAVQYEAGAGTRLVVYPSSFAGTNQATSVSWMVADLDATIADLKSRGVTFEHYDFLPDTTVEGDVHIFGGVMRGAWFTDPDGNIHGLTEAS